MSKLGIELHESFAVFRVWAPFAKAVALQGDFSGWQDIAMTKDDKTGTWEVRVEKVKPGHAYHYHIRGANDQELYKNDPRARSLTDSDDGHGVVSDGKFDWDGAEKVQLASREKQVIYEMHLGTFNRPDPASPGTFYTAIEKLDHLTSLGITTIELMPVTSMATSFGWGYAPNAIYSVESLYGGAYAMKCFIRAAHQKGLAVILDVVYNHFFSATDLWQYDGWSENNRGGIYFYNDERGDTPWGGRPDYGRAEVRDFILDNIAMWLNDYHVDGFRLDSTIYMRNTKGQNNDPSHDIPDAWRLMSDITKLAHKIRPDALVIAEDCSGNAMITNSTDQGGAGFDAQWDLGLPHVIRGALHIGNEAPGLQNLVNVMGQSFNGDWMQRVVFSDSHDTAANGGKRLVATGTPDTHSVTGRRMAILSSAVALTTPGIPMILAGSEFLQGGDFNDWDALDWHNNDKFSGIVEAHRHLIALRTDKYNNTAGLLSGDLKFLLVDENCRVLIYQRGRDDNQPVIVVVNFSGIKWTDYRLPLPDGDWVVKFNSSWRGYSSDFSEFRPAIVNNQEVVTLPPLSVIILGREN